MGLFSTRPGVNARFWTDGVEVENEAVEQVRAVGSLPILAGPVAVMPDVHAGKGSTVGTVIATKGALIPAAVGVDIGCGMCAIRTSLTASDLPDSLAKLRADIEAAVPVGFGQHDGYRLSKILPHEATFLNSVKLLDINRVIGRSDMEEKAWRQRGTLGGGNHFIEVCLDKDDRVWVMLHSGSRGVGNLIGQAAITTAKEIARERGYDLPDSDLAWLSEGTPEFNSYETALRWAQNYAHNNRDAMMTEVLFALRNNVKDQMFECDTKAINCHHNYANLEYHEIDGKNELVWVTRKGAVRALVGELGIIPGSMGAKSYIVRGLGSNDSYHSCSHGAGRRMSRGAAKRRFTEADVALQTAGVECRKDAGVVDEIPAAYKDIDSVMAAQSGIVEVVHELRQVLCVKG